jgi:hypothetical protein
MGNGIAHYCCAQKFYFRRDWGMGEWFIHIDGEWTFEKQSIILKKSSIKINVLFPIPHSLFPIPQKALHQMKVILCQSIAFIKKVHRITVLAIEPLYVGKHEVAPHICFMKPLRYLCMMCEDFKKELNQIASDLTSGTR